jgi:hypothetical protein
MQRREILAKIERLDRMLEDLWQARGPKDTATVPPLTAREVWHRACATSLSTPMMTARSTRKAREMRPSRRSGADGLVHLCILVRKQTRNLPWGGRGLAESVRGPQSGRSHRGVRGERQMQTRTFVAGVVGNQSMGRRLRRCRPSTGAWLSVFAVALAGAGPASATDSGTARR